MSATQEESREEAPDSRIQEASATGPLTREVPAPATGPVQTPSTSRTFGSTPYGTTDVGLRSYALRYGSTQSVTPGGVPAMTGDGRGPMDRDVPAREHAARVPEELSPGAEARARVSRRREPITVPIRQIGDSDADDETAGGYHSETLGTPYGSHRIVRLESVAETQRRLREEKRALERKERFKIESTRTKEADKQAQEVDSEWITYQKKLAREREAQDKHDRQEFEARRQLAIEQASKDLAQETEEAA